MSGEYFLGGSEWAAARLRLQHELTKTNLNGHVLDPCIPPLKPGMAVADVACGTGVWLLDVVDLCPGITAEGLDVNIDNVPPKKWLPQHVYFHHFDLLKELPHEYASRYDIINVQFLTSFVRDEHIGLAMGNLVKMLKAGGYLQFTESEPARWTYITATGDTHPPENTKLYTLIGDIFGGYGQWQWLANIERTFQEAGLQDVVCRQPKAKPSTRQPNLQNILLAQIEAGEMVRKHPVLKGRSAEHREQREKAAKEARELGAGMDLALKRCSGRKAAA